MRRSMRLKCGMTTEFVVFVAVMMTAAHAIRITQIQFEHETVMRVQLQRTTAECDASYIACATNHCMAVPTGADTVFEMPWQMQPAGDLFWLLDDTMHTLDWVAWGAPPRVVAFSMNLIQSRVRTYKCANVWNQPCQPRGLAPTGSDGAWEWIPEPTMPSCLAAVAPISASDMNTTAGAIEAEVAVLHL